MNENSLRMAVDQPRSLLIVTCLTCGNASEIPFSWLRWQPPSAITAASSHACEQASSTPGPVDVPRPPEDAVGRERVAEYVRVHLRPSADRSAYVDLQDLLTHYSEVTGDYPGSGRFARRLRPALPAGTGIHRSMINGIKARRVHGATLAR